MNKQSFSNKANLRWTRNIGLDASVIGQEGFLEKIKLWRIALKTNNIKWKN